ncbi:MAG: prepilin-type N-terminal cleavage/methylation domain-containing protein [Myxococcota bacterium]|jgi:prepilin-type N-terminal cleavage/methylation domain-containing protein
MGGIRKYVRPSGGLRGGYTLYELLVAMAISTILMVIVYTIYIRAARSYRVQNMAIEQQNRARFGVEHLRRDIANAGFNGATNTSQDPNVCFAPNGDIRALTLQQSSQSTSLVNPSKNVNITPLEITLFGDYAGQGEIFYTASVVGSTITLQDDGVTFGPNLKVTQEAFENIFKSDGTRYLRIADAEQYEMLIPITGNNFNSRTVTVSVAPPQRSGSQACGIQGFGQALQINSAMYMRYRLTVSNATTGQTDLVREVLDVNRNVVAGSLLTIAEYVVDLNAYDFVFDVDETKLQPSFVTTPLPDTSIVDSTGSAGQLGTLSATSQDLRFMTIKLTVRSEDEDPDYKFQPRVQERLIRSYEVFTDLDGAARTFSMTSKIMLQNLAMRNI